MNRQQVEHCTALFIGAVPVVLTAAGCTTQGLNTQDVDAAVKATLTEIAANTASAVPIEPSPTSTPQKTSTPRLTKTPRPTRTPKPTATPDSMEVALNQIARAKSGDQITIINRPSPLIYRVARVGSYQLSVLEEPPHPNEQPYVKAALRNPDCLIEHMSARRAGSGRLIFTQPNQLAAFDVRVSVGDSFGGIPVLTLIEIDISADQHFSCPEDSVLGDVTGRLGNRLKGVPGSVGEITGFAFQQALEGFRQGWDEGKTTP